MSNKALGNSVYEMYREMISHKIISAYHGEFSQPVIEMLLKQAKSDLIRRNIEKKTLKKTYSILIECLENILKHTNTSHDISPEAVVLLSSIDNGICITVGNIVHEEEKNGIEERIKQVNSLSREELQELHTSKLINTSISHKGGAGLGLIEISLKSKNKIEYFFKEYRKNLVFFAFQTRITN